MKINYLLKTVLLLILTLFLFNCSIDSLEDEPTEENNVNSKMYWGTNSGNGWDTGGTDNENPPEEEDCDDCQDGDEEGEDSDDKEEDNSNIGNGNTDITP